MFETFKNRYVFTGEVKFSTPFHIGSGGGNVMTDAAVVKYNNEKPYIPGSSFKGLLRSTVERIGSALDIDTCHLFSDMECSEYIKKGMKNNPFNLPADEDQYLDFILEQVPRGGSKKGICKVCRLFGCTYLASKVSVDDLTLVEGGNNDNISEIRDGVGIDRDTGTAVEGVKFDFEVVSQDCKFKFNITVDNVEFDDTGKSTDLVLLSVGFSEFLNNAKLGGLTSRGLGSFEIENGDVYWINLESTDNKQKFLEYLATGKLPNEMQMPLKDFVFKNIGLYF